MAQFALNEIDEAKRRVQDMQNRAKQITGADNKGLDFDKLTLYIELLSPIAKSDRDLTLLLAILSSKNEEVDKTLLLALLYILL